MYLDVNGPDLFRLQKSTQSRIADVLDPDVLFSGNYEDGQAWLYTLAVDASGGGTGANSKSYTLNFNQTFNHAPFVFGTLKLSAPLIQNSQTIYNSGEYITPVALRYQYSGQLPTYNYSFTFNNTQSLINLTVAGMVGTAIFLVFEVD